MGSRQILYQNKLHTLRNLMMYTLPKFESEEARLNTYETCTDGHAGIKRSNGKRRQRSNRSLNIYGRGITEADPKTMILGYSQPIKHVKLPIAYRDYLFCNLPLFNYGLNLRSTDLAVVSLLHINGHFVGCWWSLYHNLQDGISNAAHIILHSAVRSHAQRWYS